MKITVYTVSDCQFSKQEKDYLKSHNLQFEEKNLETNKDFLTEMLAVSDNFAGTPVTRIEKDDGQIKVLKGFTQSEFDEALGFKPTEPTTLPPKVEETSSASTPVAGQPTPGVLPTTPSSPTPTTQQPSILETPPIPTVIEPPQPTPQPPQPTSLSTDLPPSPNPQPPSNEQPAISTAENATQTMPDMKPADTPQEAPATPQDPRLTSVLSDLQSMGNTTSPNDANNPKPNPPNMPSVPDPNFG